MDIDEKIKSLRLEKNLTQQQLAEKANISRVAIGHYERGDRIPNIDILSRIGAALDVHVANLITADKTLGNNIKTFRSNAHISRESLAHTLDISIHTLIKYEQGQRQPNIEMLNKLATVLGVSINELIGATDNNSELECKTLADYSTEELLLELLKRTRK